MRRIVLGCVSACMGALMVACGVVPIESGAADGSVGDTAEVNGVPRVESARVERWPEWSMPEPGPFDESLPKEEMFRPCRDIPDEVAEDLGIRIKRDSEDEFLSFLCEAEFLDPALKNTPVSFTSESVAVSGWFERGNRAFKHFVPGFPEAVAAKGTTLRNASSVSCESMVETPRGVIAVMFADAGHERPPEYLCVQPDRIIRELFERQQASA